MFKISPDNTGDVTRSLTMRYNHSADFVYCFDILKKKGDV